MLYLINPATRRRKKRRIVATKSKRRPSRKQMAARRKFAAMSRARSRAAKSTKRVRRTKGAPVAVKRRRRSTAKRRGVMQSVKRRSGAKVARSSWRSSGYRRNPKRRRNTHRRSNPGFRMAGLPRQIMDLGTGAVVVLAGGAAGRTVSSLIPFGGVTPLAQFAKGALVAIGIKMFAPRLIGKPFADLAAIGAMIGPTKDLVISILPQAAGFLGAYGNVMALPTWPGQRSIGAYAAYAAGNGSEQDSNDDESGMGAYTQEVWG